MTENVTVAVEVWIATALLHTEHPERSQFSVKEIVDRVMEEKLAGEFRSGVQTHASQHCVANKRPNPNRYRMLYAVGRGQRRLFRPGDEHHPFRRDGWTAPSAAQVPLGYQHLLDWYHQSYCQPQQYPPTDEKVADFRAKVASVLGEHLGVELQIDRPIPIGNPPRAHRFDLVSAAEDYVGCCRQLEDTRNGGVTEASLGELHQAVFFLSKVPANTFRFLVLPKPGGRSTAQSLAEYYYRTYRHLLDGVQLIELNVDDGTSRDGPVF